MLQSLTVLASLIACGTHGGDGGPRTDTVTTPDPDGDYAADHRDDGDIDAPAFSGDVDHGWQGDVDPADATWTVNGAGPDNFFGAGVIGAGDVDGDGVGDLAVAGAVDGSTYLFRGPISAHTAVPTATFLAQGTGESVGEQVGRLGDQDGDGYDDLLIQAAYGGTQGYVVLGPVTGSVTAADVASATFTGFTEGGPEPSYSLGDVDGDDQADLVFGVGRGDSWAGAAFVFYGPVTTGEHTAADADATVSGTQWGWCDGETCYPGSFTGTVAAANGDVDGDGIDDVMVTSPDLTASDTYSGIVSLFYGPLGGDYDADAADVLIDGAHANAEIGATASMGGDLDGDGLEDMAFSSTGSTGTSIFYATSVADYLDVADRDAFVDGYGRIDTSGDLDADGYDDLIVGPRGVYGPIEGYVARLDVSFLITVRGGALYTPEFVGDVSGDGIDDMTLSNLDFSSPAGDYVGRVLLFAGATR